MLQVTTGCHLGCLRTLTIYLAVFQKVVYWEVVQKNWILGWESSPLAVKYSRGAEVSCSEVVWSV